MNERQRLEQIIESEGLTAKQFAEEVGIQAGTISNIVNGRNNPSLDVTWRSSMYRTNGAPDTTLFDIKPIEVEQSEHQEIKAENKPEQIISAPAQSKVIDKIMIFYTDGTFEER